MIIGILSVRTRRYHPNRRLMEAARRLGHRAVLVHPKKLLIGLKNGKQGYLTLDHLPGPLDIDVLLPRLGGTIQAYPLTLIRHFEGLGIRVVNSSRAIDRARNKFRTLQTLVGKGIPVPESKYVSNRSNFDAAVARLGGPPVVLKRPKGRQGSGVFLFESMDQSGERLDALLPAPQGLIVQKFIPTDTRRDLRMLVVGGRIADAMSLKPKKGDFRSNVHLHSRTEPLRPTEAMARVAIEATEALGLEISGVDMIEEKDGGLRVVDVNFSPGFKGLERCTGNDMALEILGYIVRSASLPL